MEKLELKHLAPYLPYGLKIKVVDGNADEHIEIMEAHNINAVLNYDTMVAPKPILRPLSDFTKEIEFKGKIIRPNHWFFSEIFGCGGDEKCESFYKLEDGDELWYYEIEVIKGKLGQTIFINQYLGGVEKDNIKHSHIIDYKEIQQLLELHFDVFGLLNKGLAVNYNDVK